MHHGKILRTLLGAAVAATAAMFSAAASAQAWPAAKPLRVVVNFPPGGAADANVFNERGLECVNLANGMTDIHTPAEHISVADLEAMVDVTLALFDVALS